MIDAEKFHQPLNRYKCNKLQMEPVSEHYSLYFKTEKIAINNLTLNARIAALLDLRFTG
jgi:hypothetical protein